MILSTGLIATAQEKNVDKKVEKKIKIVTIDEEGNRIEKDTVLKGDATFYVLESGEKGTNSIYTIVESDKDGKAGTSKTFTIVKSGEEGNSGSKKNVYIMSKDSGGTFTVKESDSLVWVGEGNKIITGEEMIVKAGDGEGNGTMVFISKPGDKSHSVYIRTDDGKVIEKEVISGIHSDLPGEGESVIIVRTKDGEEILKIKGDAVITIKDGNVKVENSNIKGNEAVNEEVVKAKKKK